MLNVNEAHAYASCSNCVTVAVAFQVVLIMDDAHVVVPQNLAVAANYECYRCITAAIASQLVLSVEETPGEEQLLALGDVWGRLTAVRADASRRTRSRRSPPSWTAFKAEIVAILDDAPPVAPGTAPPTASPTGHPHRQQRTVADRLVARAVVDQPERDDAHRQHTSDTAPTDTTPADPAPTDTTPTETTPTVRHHRSGTAGGPHECPAVSRPDDRCPGVLTATVAVARASAAHPSVKNAATTSAAVVSDRSSAAPGRRR